MEMYIEALLLGFGALQTITIFVVGWFIKLMIRFSDSLKALEEKMEGANKEQDVKIQELEKEQARDAERFKGIRNDIGNLDGKMVTGFQHISESLTEIKSAIRK